MITVLGEALVEFRAISLSEDAAMRVVLTIKESIHGLWCICSGETVLYDRLHFAHAIRLARGLAREGYVGSGHSTSVEMACSEFTIVLAQYAGAGEHRYEPTSVAEHRSTVKRWRQGGMQYAQ
ncbi:MAG: hypothetical protein ACYC0F_14330 [Rhodanobacter sp.]